MISLVEGDCLEVLKTVPSSCVDSVVTDPPAGIDFMKLGWDSDKGGRTAWIAWLTSVMGECYRVLKPGGHVLVWALPKTSHWTATAVEDAGFEIRDVITHLTGNNSFPKSTNISKALDRHAGASGELLRVEVRSYEPYGIVNTGKGKRSMTKREIRAPATEDAAKWKGWGTALKPCSERWLLAQKPDQGGDWVLARKAFEGHVADNVARHGTGALNIDKARIPDGDPNGRWPPNSVFSHDEECGDVCVDTCPVLALDTQSGVTKSKKASYTSYQDSGGASRFFYCLRPARGERDEFNTHPTVKSVKLMRYLCTLVTPPGGTVLDPFTGSGSTALAAIADGFSFLGIEKEPEYVEIARRRIENAGAAVTSDIPSLP